MQNKKRILVTGGAGFIGSHLVQYLVQQNWEVVVLDNCCVGNKLCLPTRAAIKFVEADVRDTQAVLAAAKGCSAIVHLAALVGVDEVIAQPFDTIEIELLGTQNIGQAAREHAISKVIYASSSAVYKNTLNERSKEDDSLNLVNDYAVAKRMNELYLQALHQETGILAIALRLFNIYGSRQDQRMVIPRFVEQAMQGKAIQVFGTGKQTRDFTHIKDVVAGIDILLKQSNTAGIFNIARGQEVSILELAQMIKKITQSNSPIQLLDFPEGRLNYKVTKRVGDPKKLLQQTGFCPAIDLELGLKQYILDFRYFLDAKKADYERTSH